MTRVTRTQAIRERNALAVGLRDHLWTLAQRNKSLPAIVMGDFNDEPFDDSVSQHLLSSRDRNLVAERANLLYNPFWRLLGERQHISEEADGRLGAGTHYFGSDQLTRWLTVDQALVSRELLGGSAWSLNELGVGIVQRSPLLNAGRLSQEFDHFPILITLEKATTS